MSQDVIKNLLEKINFLEADLKSLLGKAAPGQENFIRAVWINLGFIKGTLENYGAVK